MKAYDFKVLLEPDETGGYVATCPSLPGCYSQGDTVDGALDNIREAIELCLEAMQAHGEVIPDPFPSPGRKRRRRPMTSGLPVVSGREAIRVFEQLGCGVVRQRGSHSPLQSGRGGGGAREGTGRSADRPSVSNACDRPQNRIRADSSDPNVWRREPRG
jgi:predicted RNase H-like HicB family nuclease